MKTLLILVLSLSLSFAAVAQDSSQDSCFTNRLEAKNQTINGLKEGKWVVYEHLIPGPGEPLDTNAAFYILTVYRNGKPVGIEREYYMKSGRLRRKTTYFKNGGSDSRRYDDSGDETSKDEIENIKNRISRMLPIGWTIRRYLARLVLYRADSAYIVPENETLNPDYRYEKDEKIIDTIDSWKSSQKYKVEIYIDFTNREWSDSTLNWAKRHNDSIDKESDKLRHEPQEGMGHGVKWHLKMTLLVSQRIDLPVYIPGYGTYITDNRPEGTKFLDVNNRRWEGGMIWMHNDLRDEMKDIKDKCTEIIKEMSSK